ncbi:MAG: HAMP domain-containing sensor histidine kinase [Actinomycetota bacterium]
MTAPVGPSPATARRLRTLRIRLAVLLGALVLVVVAVFAAAVIRLDARLRAEQDDATLFREIDEVVRGLSFDDAQLQPTDPTELLGESVIVGIRPDFDVIQIVEEDGALMDQIPEPDPDEFSRLVEELFFDLEPEIQDELLDEGDFDGSTRGDRVEQLLVDPPDGLIDEAYRVYLFDVSAELGIELVPPTTLHLPPVPALPDVDLIDVVDRVADGVEPGRFVVDDGERSLAVRGAVLRDGPEVRGAVVAFVDLAASEAAHRRLRDRTLLLAGGLVGLASVAAWLLAGRSIGPAAAALGQQERFLAAAAHELRTPIAAIRATAEAPPGPEGPGPRLARTAELAAGASQLTDDLLTLARMDADRMELTTTPLRLDLLVEAVVDGNPAHRLSLTPVVVDGDASLLNRAVENLVRNAERHGGATATTPSTVVVDERGVLVADDGPGIPADERELVFERFRTGPRSGGHGLGLPLARWIARAHGGDLRVEPSSSGTHFRLSIPAEPVD